MAATVVFTDNHPTTLTEAVNQAMTGNLRLHVMQDTHTFTAADAAASPGSLPLQIEFPSIMGGRVLVFPYLSRFTISQCAATTVADIGYRTYNRPRISNLAQVVAENLTFFNQSIPVDAGSVDNYWTELPTSNTPDAVELDAMEPKGLIIVVNLRVAAVIAGGVIKVAVVYGHID